MTQVPDEYDMCPPPADVGLLFSSRTKPQPLLPLWCYGTTTPFRARAPPSVGQRVKTGSVKCTRLFTRRSTVFIQKCEKGCNRWHNAVTGRQKAEVGQEGEQIPLQRLEIIFFSVIIVLCHVCTGSSTNMHLYYHWQK